MQRCVSIATILFAFACQPCAVWAAEPSTGGDLPLVFSDNFEHGSDRWEPTDAEAWKVVQSRGGHAYSLFKQSRYKPPQRSPVNFALAREAVVGDFVLEADVLSTKPDYGHRDMCLVFGYQDAAHFYYVHFGKKTDDHANQIFIVDGKARQKISTKTTPGTDWDDRWHHVKITRRVDLGTIAVYFDDLQHPAMEARDTTFTWGRIGLGSFDDIGDWDNVQLNGRTVQPAATTQPAATAKSPPTKE